MLQEIPNVAQRHGDPLRAWFTDDQMDLILWQGDDKKLAGFQLVYDKKNRPRAMTWRRDRGFQHHQVDDGEMAPLGFKQTPILLPDGVFDNQGILSLFLSRSSSVGSEIAQFIAIKLVSFPVDEDHEPPRIDIK